ncbi:MAG: hypothetical protein SGBAC_010540 [Bacillariaceae sp.]
MVYHTTTRSMATAAESFQSVVTSPGGIFTSVVGLISVIVYIRYQEAIRRRIRLIKDESWLFGAGVTMVRGEQGGATNLFPNLQLLEVNPEFQKAHPEYNFVGLGEYMTTLRPKQLPPGFSAQDLPKLLQSELEAGMASALLKALGPNLGRALLPAVGIGPIAKKAQGLASRIATRWVMSKQAGMATLGEAEDRGGLPVSILSVMAVAESNAKLNSGKTAKDDGDDNASTNSLEDKLPGTGLSAIDKMINGENVNGPTFDTELVPNDSFVLLRDFHTTIKQMEARIINQGQCADHAPTELQTAQAEMKEQNDPPNCGEEIKYDPNDRRMGDPVPINPRLFPDLHLGYGDAENTHTKRQVLQMRLLSVLLNRLASNYHRMANGETVLFQMKLVEGGPIVTTPDELIQGLMDMGQEITLVPTSRVTSFGLGMCLKEKDGSWSHIPLGVFLESGFEDSEGNMAPVVMPHSGVRIIIGDGPLTHKQEGEYTDFQESALKQPLIIQHFIGIEGFCGWKSDGNPDVPFNTNVESGSRLTDPRDVARAVRLSGLYATVLNGLATDLDLPFGGYGATAVCNDSAAIIQQCLYGTSYIFPLTSIGRYMQRTLTYAKSLRNKLQDASYSGQVIEDMKALEEAMLCLPSDINASPGEAPDAARRLLHTLQPERPLALMNDSKMIMERIQADAEVRKSSKSIV